MGGRRGSGRREDAPGPGAYQAKTGFDKKGGVMGMRPQDKFKGTDGPGPGSYGVKGSLGGPGGKWGKGGRDPGRHSIDGPGPGSYSYGNGPSGGFAMGKAPRSA